MSKSAVHMIVRGRVQGVGFRFFVRGQASVMGVAGWVKNLPDGSVEIHAEAEREVLEKFVEKVRRGPVFAHVDEIVEDWTEPENAYYNFNIEF